MQRGGEGGDQPWAFGPFLGIPLPCIGNITSSSGQEGAPAIAVFGAGSTRFRHKDTGRPGSGPRGAPPSQLSLIRAAGLLAGAVRHWTCFGQRFLKKEKEKRAPTARKVKNAVTQPKTRHRTRTRGARNRPGGAAMKDAGPSVLALLPTFCVPASMRPLQVTSSASAPSRQHSPAGRGPKNSAGPDKRK